MKIKLTLLNLFIFAVSQLSLIANEFTEKTYFSTKDTLQLVSCRLGGKQSDGVGLYTAIFKIEGRPNYVVCSFAVNTKNIAKVEFLGTVTIGVYLNSLVAPDNATIQNLERHPATDRANMWDKNYFTALNHTSTKCIMNDELLNKFREWCNKAAELKPEPFKKPILGSSVFEWNGEDCYLWLHTEGFRAMHPVHQNIVDVLSDACELVDKQGDKILEKFISSELQGANKRQNLIDNSFK